MEKALKIENTKQRAAALRAVVEGWSGKDPGGAKAWFAQVSDEAVRRDVAPALIAGLTREDADAALALARSLPAGWDREQALGAVANALFDRSRPDEAVKVAAEIPIDAGNADLAQFYQRWIAANGGAATRSMMERATRSEEERAAVEELLTPTARFSRDPAAVAAALAEVQEVAVDDFRRRLLENVTSQWASRDVAKARTWAESLPEGAARERALTGVAAGWTGTSMNEVTAWLDALPASASREAAVGRFARKILPRDPGSALAWMRTIPDETTRTTLLQNAWQEWIKRDRAPAERWRDTSPDLQPAERARLR